MNEDKAKEKPIEFPPPKMNDANNDANNEENKVEKETKSDLPEQPVKRQESYMTKILRQRKVRYLAAYKKRIERVYTLKDPTKLSKVDGFVEKYGVDADKIHDLYAKICKKYSLEPCKLYEGDEHEPPIPADEKEKVAPKLTTPEQTLSKTLTDEPAKPKEPTFKFVVNDTPKKAEENKPSQCPFSWGTSIEPKKKEEPKKVSPAPINGGFSWSVPAAKTSNDEKKEDQTNKSLFSVNTKKNEPKQNGFSWPSSNDNKPKETKTETKPTSTWDFGGSGFKAATPKKEEKKTPAPTFGTSPSPFATNNGDKDKKKSTSTWSFGDTAAPTSSFPATPAKTEPSTDPWSKPKEKTNDFGSNGGAMVFNVPSNGFSFSATNKNENDTKVPMDSGMSNNGFTFGGTSNDKPKLKKSSTEPLKVGNGGVSFGTPARNELSKSYTFSWGAQEPKSFSFGNNQNDSTNKSNMSGFSWSGNNNESKPNNSIFGNDNNNKPPTFGNSGNNTSGFNASFNGNAGGNTSFGSSSFGTSAFGSNNNTNTNTNGWGSSSFGATNNNNNDNNNNTNGNSFSFGSNNNQSSGGNGFSFQPTNSMNGNGNAQQSNALGSGFFNRTKKRKVVKAKRRLKK